MGTERVTLKDIAKACGYTANTVSRGMRDDPRLPATTRLKIREAAEKLGYIPNTLASSLRSGRRNTVAVIINDVRNLHFCRMLSRLDPELRNADYNEMILCTRSDGALSMQMVQAAISQSMDGVIYFPNLGDRKKIEYIQAHGIPLVLMDRYAEGWKPILCAAMTSWADTWPWTTCFPWDTGASCILQDRTTPVHRSTVWRAASGPCGRGNSRWIRFGLFTETIIWRMNPSAMCCFLFITRRSSHSAMRLPSLPCGHWKRERSVCRKRFLW